MERQTVAVLRPGPPAREQPTNKMRRTREFGRMSTKQGGEMWYRAADDTDRHFYDATKVLVRISGKWLTTGRTGQLFGESLTLDQRLGSHSK